MAQVNPFDFLLIVTVHPEDVKIETREFGTDKKRTIRTQSAYFKKPSRRYPELFKFSLADDQQMPYQAGTYLLHPDCFGSGDYDSLELNRYGIKLASIPPELLALAK